MTDSLEARRAALEDEARQRIIMEASDDWREMYQRAERRLLGEHEDGCEARLFHYHPTHDGDPGVRVTDCICPALRAAFARGVESRPPVDVEAALDGLTRYDTDWENGNSIAAKDYGKYVLHSEVLDLLRTVTTRED